MTNTTPLQLLQALEDINELLEKADDIFQSLSLDAQNALIDAHGENTNLAHIIRWGVQNSNELLESMESMEKIYIKDDQEGCFAFKSDVQLPYKSEDFPLSDQEKMAIDTVYIPEYADGVEDCLTANDFIRIVRDSGVEDEDDNIVMIAHELWMACEWQHPQTLIDDLGIQYFVECSTNQSLNTRQ